MAHITGPLSHARVVVFDYGLASPPFPLISPDSMNECKLQCKIMSIKVFGKNQCATLAEKLNGDLTANKNISECLNTRVDRRSEAEELQ